MIHAPTWLVAAVLVAAPVAVSAQEGDAETGMRVFNKCASCHSVKDQTRRIGPTLNGVVGRAAGTLPDFHYSNAMREAGAAGLVWTEAEIADYLANPKTKIPGNSMTFIGLKNPQEVADVIAYIRRFSPGAN